MSIGILHNYIDGGLLKSSEWNSELDQILAVLGYSGITNPNLALMISGQIDDDSILKLDNLSTGDILQVTNGTLNSLFKNSGQISIGANGVVGLIITSNVKCTNLNADLLDSKNASDLEQKLYSAEAYMTIFDSAELDSGKPAPSWICGNGGAVITKLKAQQTGINGVPSVGASTVIAILKNGVSLGNVTITGNTNAVQTNDIVDNVCVEGDIISFTVLTHSGGTPHSGVTAGFHYKKKFTI